MEKGDIPSEIRCKEEAKGGVKYDVIIAEAASPPPVKFIQSPSKVMTSDDIIEKLKAAEERRLSLEAKKTASIGEYIEKVDTILKKKTMKEAEDMMKIKQKMTEKMESHLERRDAILSEMKNKLKEQADMVVKVNEELKHQEKLLMDSIMSDLENATIRREANMRKTIENIRKSHARQRALRRSLDMKKVPAFSNLNLEDRVEVIRQMKKLVDGAEAEGGNGDSSNGAHTDDEVKSENGNGEISNSVEEKK